MNLAGEDHRVDDRAAIVDHDIFEDLQLKGQRIDFEDDGMNAVGGGAARRPEILRRLQARLGSRLDRAPHRIGALREFAKPNEFLGNPDDRYLAVGDNEIILGTFEGVAGELQGFLPHDTGGFIDGVAGHHRAAARKRSGAPIELIGVAGNDIDLGDIDTELVGGNLRKAREMALALGADPGRDAHLAVRLHLDLGAFIGSDASTFDITGDADAHATPLCAQLRLFVLDEVIVSTALSRTGS